MGHNHLQVVARFRLNTWLGLEVVRPTGTVHLALLELLINVLAVLADWVKSFHKHAVGTDLRRRCGSCRLR